MLATTTDELETLFRQDVSDELTDPEDTDDTDRLWKSVEVYRYMTQACDALAKRTLGLHKIVEIAVVDGESSVRLPKYVLHINRAWLQTADVEVYPRNLNRMRDGYLRDDYGLPGFGNSTRYYTRDYEKGYLVLTPEPTEADTLELQCSITIATPMVSGMMLPFTDPEDQDLLLTFMKSRAYRKQDAETLDMKRALDFAQDFAEGARDRKATLEGYRRTPAPIRMEY